MISHTTQEHWTGRHTSWPAVSICLLSFSSRHHLDATGTCSGTNHPTQPLQVLWIAHFRIFELQTHQSVNPVNIHMIKKWTFAISYICLTWTVPTTSVPGLAAPLSTPAHCGKTSTSTTWKSGEQFKRWNYEPWGATKMSWEGESEN